MKLLSGSLKENVLPEFYPTEVRKFQRYYPVIIK